MFDRFLRLFSGFAVDSRGTARLLSRRATLDLAIATLVIVMVHVAVAYSGLGIAIVRWAYSLGVWDVEQASLTAATILLAAAWYGVALCHGAYDHRRRIRSDNLLGATFSTDVAQGERAVFAFLADLGHGLRTPLPGILGFSNLMKNESRGPIGNAKYAAYIEQIRDDSRHMLSIVDDLPAMSRLDSDAAMADAGPTRVDAAIRASMHTVSPENCSDGGSGGRIILQLDHDLPLLGSARPTCERCSTTLWTTRLGTAATSAPRRWRRASIIAAKW